MSGPAADVIVIGGGPAGVAAAVEMRRRGVEKVILLEREPHLGGATRHCGHSPFGMLEFRRVYIGASYGRRLEQEAEKHGVDVRLGHSVVRIEPEGRVVVTSDKGVETLAARRVMLSTGAREKPRSARLVSGDRPIGVLTTGALQAYVAFHNLMPFRRPLIVGTELVSFSAILTCLSHAAKPVAMIEPRPHTVARAPFSLLPKLIGIPVHWGAEIVDIIGRARVEKVVIRRGDNLETVECDGVLFTGQFTPEASLFMSSPLGVDPSTGGPAIDQDGRTLDPGCFAAGNVLRAVETGGWAYREGRAIGRAIASDLGKIPPHEIPVQVGHDEPIKLVVPSLLRREAKSGALGDRFQLRIARRTRGRLALEIDGKVVWHKAGKWMPERRVLVPIPPVAATAKAVKFTFREE